MDFSRAAILTHLEEINQTMEIEREVSTQSVHTRTNKELKGETIGMGQKANTRKTPI